ncbi:hypothetical protein CsatA_015837 [Cannabis sativa]
MRTHPNHLLFRRFDGGLWSLFSHDIAQSFLFFFPSHTNPVAPLAVLQPSLSPSFDQRRPPLFELR